MNTSPVTDKLVVRKCRSIDELRACVNLQQEVWKFEDADMIPLRMFVVAEKIGGQVIGGFDGDTLVGYALSIPGSRDNHAYLHSHMLAVRESYRNSGLGKRLKLAQRQDALQRGFALIEWTFDPLEIKNAYLNLVSQTFKGFLRYCFKCFCACRCIFNFTFIHKERSDA